jgi:hypothetical protein
MRPKSLRPILIIGFLTVVGAWLMMTGWNAVHENESLDQRAAIVEGTVIEAETRALAKGGQSSTLVVEFTPQNHKPITRKFDVDGDTYRASLESGKASVTHLPENPEISRVTRFAILPFQILVGLGAFMLVAALACLFHALRKNKRT